MGANEPRAVTGGTGLVHSSNGVITPRAIYFIGVMSVGLPGFSG
jgi:hypothetical protein